MRRVTNVFLICDTPDTSVVPRFTEPSPVAYTSRMALEPVEERVPLLTGFTLQDLQSLVDSNPYLRGYLQGYLAEALLAARLRDVDGVTSVTKIPDASDKWGDLLVTYKGKDVVIECKSMCSGSIKRDVLNEVWEGSVLCKNTDKRIVYVEGVGEVQSVNLHKGDFDVLAICTYPVTGDWQFLFMENRFLPEPDDKPGFIKSKFVINTATTAGLEWDVEKILNDVVDRKCDFLC